MKLITTIIAAAAMVLAAATPVHAAPGGKPGKPVETIFELDQPNPSQGDTITFTVQTDSSDRPFSKVNCYRDGFHIYSSSAGHFDDYYYYFGAPDHLLASLNWLSGPADCVASLEYMTNSGRMRTLVEFDFYVTG